MKTTLSTLLLCLTLSAGAAGAADMVEPPADCKHCGMNRTTFAQSRMVVTYADGSSSGTCSLSCAVTDMREAKGKPVKALQVADYTSKLLIDAKTASWVMGGSKKGVMTPVAKWAFASPQNADAFIKLNGGTRTKFDDALKQTEEEKAGPQGGKRHQHKGH